MQRVLPLVRVLFDRHRTGEAREQRRPAPRVGAQTALCFGLCVAARRVGGRNRRSVRVTAAVSVLQSENAAAVALALLFLPADVVAATGPSAVAVAARDFPAREPPLCFLSPVSILDFAARPTATPRALPRLRLPLFSLPPHRDCSPPLGQRQSRKRKYFEPASKNTNLSGSTDGKKHTRSICDRCESQSRPAMPLGTRSRLRSRDPRDLKTRSRSHLPDRRTVCARRAESATTHHLHPLVNEER